MSYGAGAAGFPNRNRAALALIFFMHMLALLAWMQQRQQRSSTPDSPRVVTMLLQPRRVPIRRPRLVPPPSPCVPALGLSKRQAGRIDRELRKGKSGVPDEPDTPMGRFRRGLEAAHIERSMSVQEDSYTSPDGVIIYRKRIGNTTICRRSGSINPLGMRGMLFANEAGDVPCPKGVQWKKD
jgi:hypothetical protein